MMMKDASAVKVKECYTCKMPKPLEDFIKSKTHKDGYRNQCKNCHNKKSKEYYYKNKTKVIKRSKAHQVLSTYGITIEEFNKRMATSNCCEICGSTERLCYDHDHDTMEFRGVLCHLCNSSLGTFGDNEEGIQKVLNYLRKDEE